LGYRLLNQRLVRGIVLTHIDKLIAGKYPSNLIFNVMKTKLLTAEIKNGDKKSFLFNFSCCPAEDSVSIKVWEEENSEYKSWKLIVDQHDPASC
jgi:hypothetical protein